MHSKASQDTLVSFGTHCLEGEMSFSDPFEDSGVVGVRLADYSSVDMLLVWCRGTSLIRNCLLPGPYRRPIPRALWWSSGG